MRADLSHQIEHVMAEVDWERIRRTMSALHWTWWDCGLPTKDRLQDTARSLLKDVASADGDSRATRTGGLVARRECDAYLSLEFVVEYGTGTDENDDPIQPEVIQA